MLEGPAADGSWVRLTYLPTREALLYEASGLGDGLKLHCRDVGMGSWEATKRCATLAAWQAAVVRLVEQAREERRVAEV